MSWQRARQDDGVFEFRLGFVGENMNTLDRTTRLRRPALWRVGRRVRPAALALALGLTLGVVTGCETNGADEPATQSDARRVEILEQHRGQAPELRTMSTRLITDKRELDALGSAALSQIPVDFESQSLVVVALGAQPTAGYGVRIDRITRYPDRLTIQSTANRPGPDQILAQVITHPFAAAVIPAQRGLTDTPVSQVDWFVGRGDGINSDLDAETDAGANISPGEPQPANP